MSATPIPRSLNFALNGIKKISIISTPPPSKKSIKTIVSRFDESLMKKVIEEELHR
jgi:transcription-repair coupling factor (superfamily II helicase)